MDESSIDKFLQDDGPYSFVRLNAPPSLSFGAVTPGSRPSSPSSWVTTDSSSSHPSEGDQRFKTKGSAQAPSVTTFHTAATDARSFTTAPSRSSPRKRAVTSKLRELFATNGIKIKKYPDFHDNLGGLEQSGKFSDDWAILSGTQTHKWRGFQEENDWCGSGMHVELEKGEQVPLEPLDEVIGHGATATIDAVRCRGIRLARKTVYLRRGLQLHDVLKEVLALHDLRHSHIIRLVGTYSQSRSFSMLLYPVANHNLAEYLDELDVEVGSIPKLSSEVRLFQRNNAWLSESSLCLVSALRYIHRQGIKHMDIKPQNILVKDVGWVGGHDDSNLKKVFLCDFGIAHIFESQDASKTDSYLGRTPKYAAPEVAFGDTHGRAADIFSLGCVLAEINTVFSMEALSNFETSRCELEDKLRPKPYHETISNCQAWIKWLDPMEISPATIALMIEKDPCQRPRLYASPEARSTASENPENSSGPESSDAASASLRVAINVITQCCSHDLDEPEPYVYDKPYLDVNKALDTGEGSNSTREIEAEKR